MASKEGATGRVRAARSQLGIDGYGAATLIGRGDLGGVYRARQRALQRTVAVKVFDGAALDDAAVRRFERLSGHPNIVTVYDSGLTADGLPYVAMEYLGRGSLADELRRMGPVDWRQAVAWGVKLAGALEYAHRLGVVHGNIKPENVLLSNYGEPELTDFGTARVVGGNQANEASDVGSLAATLLTLSVGAPASLQAVFDKAMANDPDERYSSARAMGRALQDVETERGLARTEMMLEGDVDAVPPVRTATAPPSAAPPSATLLPAPRPARSRRPAIAVGALLVLAVVAVVVATRHHSSTSTPKANSATATALPAGASGLTPGAYRSDAFVPGVAFRVDSGWSLAGADTANLLQLTRADTPGAVLGFHMIDEVIDPASAPTRGQDVDPTVRALPSDAGAWLRANSRLQVSLTGPSTIGGRGAFVDFTVTGGYRFDNGNQSNPCATGSCVMLFRTLESPPTLVGAVAGDMLRFYLVPKATRLLVISVSAPAAEYASFSDAAQRVLATLTVTRQ